MNTSLNYFGKGLSIIGFLQKDYGSIHSVDFSSSKFDSLKFEIE